MWVIDVIRAGLVEGKLSQLNQTFLIHRATYRLFGLDQWVQIGERLDTWKATLANILEVVKSSREAVEAQNARDEASANQKAGDGMGRGHPGKAIEARDG